jgi:hypothetical protein
LVWDSTSELKLELELELLGLKLVLDVKPDVDLDLDLDLDLTVILVQAEDMVVRNQNCFDNPDKEVIKPVKDVLAKF